MPIVILPNGAYRVFPFNVSAYDVAQDISLGLARSALAGRPGTSGWGWVLNHFVHTPGSIRQAED